MSQCKNSFPYPEVPQTSNKRWNHLFNKMFGISDTLRPRVLVISCYLATYLDYKPKHIHSYNHRVRGWLRLDGTSGGHVAQPPPPTQLRAT